MMLLPYPQGSQEWLDARAGVTTASRFAEARQMVGGLTEQQALYVKALQAGKTEAAARADAGYKAAPRAEAIAKALAGQPLQEPGAAAVKYAWLIAMERIASKPLDDTYVTWQMRRGQELEPEARMTYELRTDALVEECGLLVTDDRLFGYSTDGFVGADGMVETKCPAACDKLGEIWSHPETAHEEYADQIHGGLWLTGRKWCDLVVYCPWLEPVGKELFIKRIWRDDDVINQLEEDLMGFERMVQRFLGVLKGDAPQDAPWVESAPDAPASTAAAPTPIARPTTTVIPELQF
jgi:hypothetical protein